MDILLQNHTGALVQSASLVELVKKVLSHLKSHINNQKDSLTVVFVSAAKMQDLNSKYRNKDYVTDVLSFSADDESMGELVFCIDKMRVQAKENVHSLESEFLYLLIHGILHLNGFEHENNAEEAKRMFKIQDDVFAVLNTDVMALF
ncbi:MAG: rRNA maturation RNase YbeY [Bdellovibrionales bacterium]|nr:rRNA maturation RNase YbeY [Bdellovibrionales bacterium]